MALLEVLVAWAMAVCADLCVGRVIVFVGRITISRFRFERSWARRLEGIAPVGELAVAALWEATSRKGERDEPASGDM